MPQKTVAIIGGGASGLVCAIECARTLKLNGLHHKIVIFEKLQRVGKKILVTGNGRCNLTNTNLNLDFFHGDKDFLEESLLHFGTEQTIEFFNSIGLLTKNEEGRVYPLSNNANSVLDCLRFEAERLEVEVNCEIPVNSIKKDKNTFLINNKFKADKIIVATGGKSSSVHGSDGSGYRLLQNLGHEICTPLPSLVQITCSDTFCKQLKGVRANANITLICDNKEIKKEVGEIQFTDYGLSGIACMQLSRYVSIILNENENSKLSAKIDLAQNLSKDKLNKFIFKRVQENPNLVCENLLIGILPKKLCQVILKVSNISYNLSLYKLSKSDIDNITQNIKSFIMHINGTKGFNNSQVTCGGILCKDFNPITFESKKVNGLFACGEVLNIDGDCGGYNLQWAWQSGFLAGKSCAEEIINA